MSRTTGSGTLTVRFLFTFLSGTLRRGSKLISNKINSFFKSTSRSVLKQVFTMLDATLDKILSILPGS
jgi:hypothetical protein